MVDGLRTPAFWVKELPIDNDLILAPMDGISDSPFRRLTRELGSGISYTEFINGIDVLNESRFLARRVAFHPAERPIAFQLLDDDPQKILKAAMILREYNPDMIDVNLGCASRTVTHRGAGAALLKEPKKIASIFDLLSKALDIPVSAKIRLGWDEDALNYMQVAKIIEENGGSLLAVHARTKTQGHEGWVNWEAIAEIKQQVSIPVIGNGGLRTVHEINWVKELTKCDGLMIGRAAMGNPWIFSRRDRNQVTRDEEWSVIQNHLGALVDSYGEFEGVMKFRKFIKRYLAPYTIPAEVMLSLLTCTEKQNLLDKIMMILAQRSLDDDICLSER